MQIWHGITQPVKGLIQVFKLKVCKNASSVHVFRNFTILKAGYLLTGHSLCVQYSDDDDDVGDKDNFCG